jgi:hypothetical protein
LNLKRKKKVELDPRKMLQIMEHQVKNSESKLKILETEKGELERQINRLAVQPNRREILESNIRKLNDEIHTMQVDKNKFEITCKTYKVVEFSKEDLDQEKKIVEKENEI